jgi:hypothetical protein
LNAVRTLSISPWLSVQKSTRPCRNAVSTALAILIGNELLNEVPEAAIRFERLFNAVTLDNVLDWAS